MLEIVVLLAGAVDALDGGFDASPRPWAADVGSFADLAIEHAIQALDAAVFAAIGSGTSIAAIEAAIGRPFDEPDWFA